MSDPEKKIWYLAWFKNNEPVSPGRYTLEKINDIVERLSVCLERKERGEGCDILNEDIDHVIHPPYTYAVYKNGKCKFEVTLLMDSQLSQTIDAWIKENHMGWTSTTQNVPPAKVVGGDKFSFNFYPDGVVLNCSVKGKKYQHFKRFNSENSLALPDDRINIGPTISADSK